MASRTAQNERIFRDEQMAVIALKKCIGDLRRAAQARQNAGDTVGAEMVDKIINGLLEQLEPLNKHIGDRVFTLVNNGNVNRITVDLHALSTDQAITQLQAVLEATKGFANSLIRTEIHLIVGRGNHSPDGARVKPAVEKFLRDSGMAFMEAAGNPGMLVINCGAPSTPSPAMPGQASGASHTGNGGAPTAMDLPVDQPVFIFTGCGKCLDIQNNCTDIGTAIWQYERNDTDAQKFYIQAAGDGYYHIRDAATRRALDVKYNNHTEGAELWMWEFHGKDGQTFKIERSVNGTYQIRPKSADNLAMDVWGESPDNCIPITLWSRKDVGWSQSFTITPVQQAVAASV